MTRILHTAPIDPQCPIVVQGDEFHYLSRVRRHKVDDRVTIVDADGKAFAAIVAQIDRRQAVLRVDPECSVQQSPDVFDVTMLIALPKGNLMDDIVRKLNEIGVMDLYPFQAERTCHTVSKSKRERWQRIAVESTRQCGRRTPLKVHPIGSFYDTLRIPGPCDAKLMLHPSAEQRVTAHIPGAAPISILIGPEGGFTDNELQVAQTSGFVPVKLNMPILRIETATIAAGVLAVALFDA